MRPVSPIASDDAGKRPFRSQAAPYLAGLALLLALAALLFADFFYAARCGDGCQHHSWQGRAQLAVAIVNFALVCFGVIARWRGWLRSTGLYIAAVFVAYVIWLAFVVSTPVGG